jgi:mannan endo-1,4-beta-mannosidase
MNDVVLGILAAHVRPQAKTEVKSPKFSFAELLSDMNTPSLLNRYLLSSLLLLATALPLSAADIWPVVTRRGDALYENDQPFRFFGLDAPNLQANESQILTDFSNRFPNDYEIRDLLDTLHRLGARATRTFSLSIFTPADGRMPCYVSGWRTYNEEAFRCLDLVIARCHEYDVRLIIPVIASQSFATIRGVDEFSALSGKEKNAFWTDETVKGDFRHLLDFILNRRNTVNGLLYKDDPAILAWQLGNEFGSYYGDRKLDPKIWIPRITDWSLEMAAYIKKVDPHHLVMEAGGDRAAFLASPYIDIISTHLYEYWNRLYGGPTDLGVGARTAWSECRGQKPLIIDEFGLATVENNRALMKTIREEGMAGGLLWSLRSHRRDGGFYVHNEGGTPINSYHFPGFAAGQQYQETQLLDLVRAEAFALRGNPLPPITPPVPAPILFEAHGGLTWRGATGASSYTIERATAAKGPWEVRATGLQDSVIARAKEFEESGDSTPVALWFDEFAAKGSTYYYRVRGFNAAGATEYSPVLEVAEPNKATVRGCNFRTSYPPELQDIVSRGKRN